MQVFRSLAEVPSDFGPSVVTIGNFDGVHLGHMQVLDTIRSQAESRGVKSVVVTFDPHPAVVHRPDAAPGLIMGTEDKVEVLRGLGFDATLVMNYTLELAGQSAEEFVKSVFVDVLRACCVVVGHDVRWGKGNSGDISTMKELGAKYGFDVIEVAEFGEERRNSSTWIREALEAGDVRTAQRILGRPHRMRGQVVHGAARGRELGFPTANLAPESTGLIPADGVYAGWLIEEDGTRWPAAISVGSNPTFEGVPRQVEAHVIDRPEEAVEDFDLYGKHVVVEFVERLRGMVAFTGIENLIFQMRQDVTHAREILATCGYQPGPSPS